MKKILCVLFIMGLSATTSAIIIRVPGDYPTIQEGINASFDGDTVLVKPGEYVENLNITERDLVLGSHFLTTGDTSYIPITVIDGDSIGTVIRITNVDHSATVTGFTIQNGYSYGYVFGAGIFCAGTAIISHNIIRDNHFHAGSDNKGGGGIGCAGSTTVISNNIIKNNIVTDGGLYYGYGGGIYCYGFNSVIKNNIITGNFACWGGGISLKSSSPIIKNNIIWQNTAEP